MRQRELGGACYGEQTAAGSINSPFRYFFFFFNFLSVPGGRSDLHILTGERRSRLVGWDRSRVRGRVPPAVALLVAAALGVSGGRAELLAASPELPQELCPPMEMKFWVLLLCLSFGRSIGSPLAPLGSLLWKPLENIFVHTCKSGCCFCSQEGWVYLFF